MTGISLSAFLLFLALALLPSRSLAGGLEGTWELDLQASDSMDEIMRLRGTPWHLRKLADTLSVTQTISVDGDRVVIKAHSIFKDMTMELKVDGVRRRETGVIEGEILVRHFWGPDGSLVSESSMELVNGQQGTITSTRYVSPDLQTMIVLFILENPGAQPLRARRIFRRR